MTTIQAPVNCPSCNSKLEWSNHLLYCRNPSCGSQLGKKIEHFAKTLKIKGLGPSSVEKLELSNLHELYALEESDIAELLSSERLAAKLYAEIQNSKAAPANLVLASFSIPLIGKTASDKLSLTIKNLFELSNDNCRNAGLGPKATENLMSWFNNEFLGDLENLPLNFSFEKPTKTTTESKGVVCISGKLKNFKSKSEATKLLESLGYVVKSSMTKDVTILINESGIESSKTQKARESGVTVVTNIKNLIGDI